MLIFTLKKEWYEKIKNGEKTIEYREVKPYWEKRILPFLFQEKPFCRLRLGYTNRYMTANITKIKMVDGNNSDLHINKPVYAIHLADIREEKQ
ncbi:MAG: hypothetical protein II821_10095 [Treponema sp.]|nr:hypothetical protein [Treponema sp.]